MREGVKWHDGTPFTAKDVKCIWDLLTGRSSDKFRLDPRKSWYRNLEEVTTNGDYEVAFHLGRPQPAFLALLASGYSVVYPCHVPPADMRQHPIGTGPFKFVEFKPNERISRLMHGDEEATMATLSARRAVVDELITDHRGRIANTAGDSVLAEFASVLDAVRCAIEIQAALGRANESEPKGRRMRFRIGVNVGNVMVKDDDIFGNGVNVAARLEGLVKGGEICVSRGVHDHLRHRNGMAFEDLGEKLVKNIAHPIRAFRLRIGEDISEQEAPIPEAVIASDLPSTPPVSELSADNEVALELALWDSVKDGSPAELESYLKQYPEGTFASLARTRRDAAAPSPAGVVAPAPADAAAEGLDLAFWNSVKDSNCGAANRMRRRIASPENVPGS